MGARGVRAPRPGEVALDNQRIRGEVDSCVVVDSCPLALDEQRFTPPDIEARPSASGARSRSYTRGSEVGDR